ncbi:MAG: phosphoenolpyruvate carboxykinase (ATP), partial [Actinomycetes bacterium]
GDGSAVAIWLDDGLTRVLGTDFFGETKKALTRMWAERVFDAGGLVLHAACAVLPTRHGPLTMVVVGAPDSGKSSLLMHSRPGVQVVQDDFVGLLPGGHVVPAENGCIEKTHSIDPVRQPLLHHAVTRPDTFLENVPQRGMDLHLDDPDGPRHARAVFPLRTVGGRADMPLPPLGLLLILEPADDVAPALVRLPVAQAPGYFLLRERRHGLAEPTGRHGNRLAALLATCAPQVLVLNTQACRDRPDQVRGGIAADVIAAALDGRIEWEADPGTGVEVARRLPAVTDADLLLPRQRYGGSGRPREYDELLTARQAERRDYLSGFVGLDPAIVAAVT